MYIVVEGTCSEYQHNNIIIGIIMGYSIITTMAINMWTIIILLPIYYTAVIFITVFIPCM